MRFLTSLTIYSVLFLGYWCTLVKADSLPSDLTEIGLKNLLNLDLEAFSPSKYKQKVTREILTQAGYEVLLASSGQEALELFDSHPVDLILMDCQMAGMDGIETTSEIRKLESYTDGRTVIVALTAHALVGDREKCLNGGMDDYLAKPVSPEQLLNTIAIYLK